MQGSRHNDFRLIDVERGQPGTGKSADSACGHAGIA